MITDMHRLERAARLSMGDFDAAPPTASPSHRLVSSSKLPAALAAVAVLAIAALFLL